MAEDTKLGSTRCLPMPSMREQTSVVTVGSASRQPGKNAELSGSATQMPVERPV